MNNLHPPTRAAAADDQKQKTFLQKKGAFVSRAFFSRVRSLFF